MTTSSNRQNTVVSGHTPGPWEYVPSNENHGPYVTAQFGSDICDCYTMSNLSALAVCNGGDSRPIHFQGPDADANARLIAAAPDYDEAARQARDALQAMIDLYGPDPAGMALHALNALDAAIAKAAPGEGERT